MRGETMSSAKWTESQEKAIYTRNKNVLVSAAAGAGKTAVLVERIIQRVLDEKEPVDIDKLLVVTFTNAAASEMKERINARLTEKYMNDSSNKHLKKQLLIINKARISTLHSFCLDLIRQNYYRLILPKGLSLDPSFRIADEVESALLRLEVMEELLENQYILEKDAFLRLVDGFGGKKDDKALQDIILKLYEYSCSQVYPFEWLKNIAFRFSAQYEDEGVQNLYINFIESMAIPLEEAVERLEEAKNYAGKPGGPDVYFQNLNDEINKLQDLLKLCYKGNKENEDRFLSCQAFIRALQELKFSSLKQCKGEVDEKLKDMVQKLRNKAKDLVRKLQKDFANRTPDKLLQDMTDMAPVMACLCELVAEFSGKYLEKKLEKNIIDFSDIEHFAINLLENVEDGVRVPSELALRLQEQFVEVLIDEYQDTNKVQDAILTYISREKANSPNLFMVGDVKQSIYAFRLADPGLFIKKYAAYHDIHDDRQQRIVLSQNFRSRDNVIDAVNFMFRQIMIEKLGGIAYDSSAELVFGKQYPENGNIDKKWPVEVHFIERKGEIAEKEVSEEETEELDAIQLEARTVGRRIMALGDKKVWDKEKKSYRPIEYRDMSILLRSTKNVVQVYIEELQKMGIPVYGDMAAGFFATTEIQFIISFLRIIDNPRQDIPLAGVLRSPVIGLSGEELAHIRLSRKKGDFYDAVRLTARNNRGKLGMSLKRFLLDLNRYRTFARRYSIGELIWFIYSETGYYDYAGALPGGRQRQANLQVLHDRARLYETTSMKGLFKFLRFLEKMEESNHDLGAAKVLGERENVVRIMSIHKSKGLEFPVVFLCGLGRKFNFRNLQEDILLDTDLGLGPNWVDAEIRLKYPTLAKIAVKHKLRMEMIAEEIRILYVALTRAREALILVGTVKNLANVVSKYTGINNSLDWELPVNVVRRAVCYFDWLIPCLLRHSEGELLRNKGDVLTLIGDKCIQDSSSWKMFLWNKEELQDDYVRGDNTITELEEGFKAFLPIAANTECQAFIDSRLSWQYPQKKLADIPAKMSVTEIKNRYQLLEQDEAIVPYFKYERQFEVKPKFLQEKRSLSAAEIGSALHMVMRHLNMKTSLSEEDIKKQIQELVIREIITKEQAQAVPVTDIYLFFQKELGIRLKNSIRVMRELPFTLALPADSMYSEEGLQEEKIIVQGTIDCLFEEKDGYVLVDYKTDLVARASKDKLRQRYKVQLDLYAQAVEIIMGYKLKEKIIYSFSLGESILL